MGNTCIFRWDISSRGAGEDYRNRIYTGLFPHEIKLVLWKELFYKKKRRNKTCGAWKHILGTNLRNWRPQQPDREAKKVRGKVDQRRRLIRGRAWIFHEAILDWLLSAGRSRDRSSRTQRASKKIDARAAHTSHSHRMRELFSDG